MQARQAKHLKHSWKQDPLAPYKFNTFPGKRHAGCDKILVKQELNNMKRLGLSDGINEPWKRAENKIRSKRK